MHLDEVDPGAVGQMSGLDRWEMKDGRGQQRRRLGAIESLGSGGTD
jgi:hypothetical protein